jgi:hypothetical protein
MPILSILGMSSVVSFLQVPLQAVLQHSVLNEVRKMGLPDSMVAQ